MKILSLFALVFFINNSINSQSLLVDNTTWSYTKSVFGDTHNEAAVHFIEGDTIINNKYCKKLHQTFNCNLRPTLDFIYEENNKIYYFDALINDFKPLYDFNANVGDTLKFPTWGNFNGFNVFQEFFDSIILRIDSITIFEYDTLNLKQFYYTFGFKNNADSLFFSEFSKGSFIEKIGNIGNFFYYHDPGWCDDYHINLLRCFSHPTYGTINFTDNEDCYNVNVGINETSQNGNITVSPNPSNGNLNIQYLDQFENLGLVVFNVNGNQTISYKNVETENDIFIENNGLNILFFYRNDELIAMKKVLVSR